MHSDGVIEIDSAIHVVWCHCIAADCENNTIAISESDQLCLLKGMFRSYDLPHERKRSLPEIRKTLLTLGKRNEGAETNSHTDFRENVAMDAALQSARKADSKHAKKIQKRRTHPPMVCPQAVKVIPSS